jgi:shikimate kinase
MNIILIGMRGSGKTTVAKKLGKKLSIPFYDTDKMIEDNVGIPLSDFIKKYGWEEFRDQESKIIEDLTSVTNSVISTGGGVVLRKKNIQILRRNGTFIFLQTSIDSMLQRIELSKDRPALTNKKTVKEELVEVWNERKELYNKNADMIIITDNKTIEEIAKEIIKQL